MLCFPIHDNLDYVKNNSWFHVPIFEHMILWGSKVCGSRKVTLAETIMVCQNYSGPHQ